MRARAARGRPPRDPSSYVPVRAACALLHSLCADARLLCLPKLFARAAAAASSESAESMISSAVVSQSKRFHRPDHVAVFTLVLAEDELLERGEHAGV